MSDLCPHGWPWDDCYEDGGHPTLASGDGSGLPGPMGHPNTAFCRCREGAEKVAQDPEHKNVHRHEDGTTHSHDGADKAHRHKLPSLGPAFPRTTGCVVWRAVGRPDA